MNTTKGDDWLKENWFRLGILIIAAVIGISFWRLSAAPQSGTKISDTELWELNGECANRAEALAKKQSGTDSLGQSYAKVLNSAYDSNKKTCFAEIDTLVEINDNSSTYKDFSVLRIYDVAKEESVSSWTYYGAENWNGEQANTLEDYNKLRKEIFGS